MTQKPLIIQYLNLIHQNKGNYDASSVQAFLSKHQTDQEFQRRALALNTVLDLKKTLG